MPLINKISRLGLGAIATAVGTAGISYLMSKKEPEKSVEEISKKIVGEGTWGIAGDQDESGGDIWWKCCGKK